MNVAKGELEQHSFFTDKRQTVQTETTL